MALEETLGILAPYVVPLANCVKLSDRRTYFKKNEDELHLFLNTKKSPTAFPSESAHQTFCKYGLSFPYTISWGLNATPLPSNLESVWMYLPVPLSIFSKPILLSEVEASVIRFIIFLNRHFTQFSGTLPIQLMPESLYFSYVLMLLPL